MGRGSAGCGEKKFNSQASMPSREFNSQAWDPSLNVNKSFLGARSAPRTPRPIGTTNPVGKRFAKKSKIDHVSVSSSRPRRYGAGLPTSQRHCSRAGLNLPAEVPISREPTTGPYDDGPASMGGWAQRTGESPGIFLQLTNLPTSHNYPSKQRICGWA